MKLYTQREVAALFRVSIRTIERLRLKFEKDGLQFGLKVGGSVRFTQEHVDMVLRPPAPVSNQPGDGRRTPAAPALVATTRKAALRGREMARQLRENEAVGNEPVARARLRGEQIAREIAMGLRRSGKRKRSN
jgi:hypothetical protein